MNKAALQFVKKGVISKSDMEFLADLDPSKTKKYLPFIIKSYLADADLDQLSSRIEEYDTLLERNQVEKKDINAFKTFQQLDEYVQKHNNIKSSREVKREIKKQADIIVDNDNLFIVCVHSHTESCIYGAGTRWCISANNSIHWNRYYDDWLITFYFVQIRSSAIKKNLQPDLCKFAIVVYPNGAMKIYDSADHLIAVVSAGMKISPLDDFLKKLGVNISIFIPSIEGRVIDISGIKVSRSLTKLDLSKKNITSIPDSIAAMTKLETLILSENRIQSLPESIGQLINLKTLYLFHNQIHSLPAAIHNMQNLQWLGLTGNSIPSKVIRELKIKLPDTRIYF